MNFHEDVLNFCQLFNEDKSANGPIQSINQKSINELRNKNKDLVVSLFFNCRLHYMSMTDRIFDLEELCTALRDIKPMSIGQSLKVFKRPNHKDRYSYLIYFLCSNPDIFSQIIYYELSYASSHQDAVLNNDDVYFFIYNSFPSFFNFFVTNGDRTNAINLIRDLFKLHFFIQGKEIKKSNRFLNDFTFSLFLATNPGKFYSSSVEPLMANLSNSVLERYLRYTKQDGQLIRNQYLMKCHDFAITLVKRMMMCAPLLPLAARQLITALWHFDETDKNFWRTYILDTLVCRYIENFVIMESDDMQITICRSLRELINSEQDRKVVDQLIDQLCVTNDLADGVSDAVEIAERSSVFTPRDLTIVYQIVNDFIQQGTQETMQRLIETMTGIDAPLLSDDNQFLLVRPWKSESILGELDLKKTSGFDEFVDIVNNIDIHNLDFNTEDQLSSQVLTFTSYFTNVSQKLRIQTNSRKMKECKNALDSIAYNKKTMQQLSDRLSSGLFFVTDEIRKHQHQKDQLSLSCIKTKLLPALVEQYPLDFTYNDTDLFSPTNSYDDLMQNVAKRVDSLNLPENYAFFLKRSFFLDLFDKIDDAFQFQSKAKVQHIAIKLSSYCQQHSNDMFTLSKHSRELVTRAAESFQQIKSTQKVSNNLRAAMNGMNLLRWISDLYLEIAIAMSGNVDLFAFSFFIGGYFKNDNITSLVLSQEEQGHIKRLRTFLHKFTN